MFGKDWSFLMIRHSFSGTKRSPILSITANFLHVDLVDAQNKHYAVGYDTSVISDTV